MVRPLDHNILCSATVYNVNNEPTYIMSPPYILWVKIELILEEHNGTLVLVCCGGDLRICPIAHEYTPY